MAIRHGIKPAFASRKDYDFHSSFGTTTFDLTTLSEELNLDAHLWMPDQNVGGTFSPVGEPNFTIPPLPEGCTDYAQTDLCIDEDGILLDPDLLEAVTHANLQGGLGDIRVSLDAARQVFKRTAYYNIRSSAALDWFNAIRVAIASTLDEKRTVSIGTPYFNEWALTPANGIMRVSSLSTFGIPWHNAKICGWKVINGTPYLIYKSWQGSRFGDGGYGYMSRELINSVMEINGTFLYTLSKQTPATIQTVDIPLVEWMITFIRNLLNL